MFYNLPMFISENENSLPVVESENSFIVSELLWAGNSYNDELLYEQIVFKVFRQPKQLISHVQRIYFTYHRKMKEQLYAALVDFLWVLEGKGQALSKRMVNATKSVLSDQQYFDLKQYLSIQSNETLIGNNYTLLTSGMVGRSALVSELEIDAAEIEHDALSIARDYIEYSQLNEAKKILEIAVIESPGRHELQTELLELYTVTKDFQAFIDLNNKLKDSSSLLSTEWQVFSDHVLGMINA